MESKNQELVDAWLNRALEEYGKAELRPGLENRVLAHLSSERERGAQRRWWWALGLSGVAATIGLAIWVGSSPQKPSPPTQVANSGSPIIRETPAANTSIPVDRHPITKPVRHASMRRLQHRGEVAAAPKLEQFPSPTPLSEQEQLLARCVNEFPKEAVMMATAQEEWQREVAAEPKWWEQSSEDSKK